MSRASQYAELVSEGYLRETLAQAFEVINRITHPWQSSGYEGRCATCGQGRDDVWHTQIRDLVLPKSRDEQEALL